MDLDRAACYRALQARDGRFDGRVFTAVRTTGIYCRPICPARTPKFENVEFFATAAGAHAAGYRPCLRCRPESSPDLAAWRGSSDTVARGLALLGSGILDEDETGVATLAGRLGVGERQLRRLFRRHLGASPIAIAQTRRVLFAKQLIHETAMSMTDVALASGFGSVRRFNDTFRRLYGRPPSALRRGVLRGIDEPPTPTGSPGVTLRLAYGGAYDWPAILDFLAFRAIPGVEIVERGAYRRTFDVGGSHGTVEVRHASRASALEATIVTPDVRALTAIVARIRRVFDLAADIETIEADLAGDPALGPLVAARPGLRVPGAWDGFELAVRAVLGQQITVAGARDLAGRLVERHGVPLRFGAAPGLTSVFPTPGALAAADLSSIGMPGARARALANLAAASAADLDLFDPLQGLDRAVARLRTLPGIGEWTAQYVAMRAIREPDAFPAADVGLLRAMTPPAGARPTPAELIERADAWRPWRAYAAQHLWTAGARSQATPADTDSEAVA